MSSRVIVNSIRHSGASVDGITLDSAGNFSTGGTITASGTLIDGKGELRTVPQVTTSSNLVIVGTHAGKHVLHSGTGGWTFNTSTGFSGNIA